MTGFTATTAQTLKVARRMQTRVRLATTTVGAAWQAIAALLLAGLLDMVWPWPAVVRGPFVLALLGVTARRLWRAWRYEKRSLPREEQVARDIERRRPEMDNALIHAVQFQSALAQESDPPVVSLIRRELARAEQAASQLPLRDVVERIPLQRQQRALAVVIGSLVLSLLLFPRVYRFEVPRFSAFWADSPPFTLTDFTVSPTGTRVRAGEGVIVTVRIGGLQPHRLELLTGGAGTPAQPVPLTEVDSNVYTAQLEGLSRDTWYYAAADTGRSARYWVRVDTAPVVRKVQVTYHPPAYTRRPDSTVDLAADGAIQGLAGTRIELEVEADRALSGGEVAIGRDGMTGLRLHLTPKTNASTQATGAFTIERAGDFRIDLQGIPADGGLTTPNAAHGKIVLQRDETPLVTITAPGQNILARTDMVVPLRVEAADDIALQRLEMHRIVNRGRDTAKVIPLPDRPREYTYTDRIDLKALHAKPGDVIEYYATGYDNDPQGVHNTDSERYWVWVVSDADYKRVLAQQRGPSQMIGQYRAQIDALRQLADAQRQLASALAANAAQLQRVRAGDTRAQARLNAQAKALRQQQRDLRDQAKELARQMRSLAQQPTQYDIEKGLQRKLAQLARAVEQAQPPMQTAQHATQPAKRAAAGQTAADQLQRALRSTGQQMDRTLQAMDRLAPLYRDLARLQALTTEQARLAQQAHQAQEARKPSSDDPFTQSRLKSLGEQQARLHEALQQVQQDLQTHAQDARSAAPAAAQTADQIAQAIGQLNIPQTMQDAQSSFERRDASNGASQAETARRALQSLFAAGQQGKQQAKGALNGLAMSQLGMGAGNSLDQMAGQMGSGMSSGNGGGQAASGGYSAPQPGSRPGDMSANGAQASGQQAMALALTMQPSGGQTRKEKHGGPRAERLGELSSDSVENLGAEPPQPPIKATDREASRYPSEYRRLVRDYFKAVAGGK